MIKEPSSGRPEGHVHGAGSQAELDKRRAPEAGRPPPESQPQASGDFAFRLDTEPDQYAERAEPPLITLDEYIHSRDAFLRDQLGTFLVQQFHFASEDIARMLASQFMTLTQARWDRTIAPDARQVLTELQIPNPKSESTSR